MISSFTTKGDTPARQYLMMNDVDRACVTLKKKYLEDINDACAGMQKVFLRWVRQIF